MTNLNKISNKDPKRMETLINRRERLIELNLINHYTQSGNAKIQKYYSCILHIRKQINELQCKNIELNKKVTRKAFRGFLNPQYAMTVKDLFNLTAPDYVR